VSEWSGVAEADIGEAVDGCGVVVFALPLDAMARAYARLARSTRDPDSTGARILNAMRTRPFLVGGTDRLDSILIEETEGRVISKVGADGVHSVAVPDQGIGIAVKVEDGAQRAQFPAVLRILQTLGVLGSDLPARLQDFLRRPIRNTRGETVGEVRLLA
jgi:L-asparaginase II